MSPEDAFSILESIAKISGTEERLCRMDPAGHEILDEQIARDVEEKAKKTARKSKSPFRFSMVGITPGERVQFVRDYGIEAVVVDDRHIRYNGTIYSLSGLAQELMHLPSLQGTKFFLYQGEILADMRERVQYGKKETRNEK